jgi:large subunit ribosomal protein L6|uniref:Large ribosomal subunit protein uL6c n=1 Tax=Acanthoceras zachariasii TaxID=451788 RepID=A0A2U9NTP1_9STRA|nr:ribosomal protein L6 [Acanthoceras zachariasii]AWT40507.1 ribosomal protein L6 [Acanthoceras zachariasii]
MSRIGKLPIKIPANVDVTFNGNDIIVKGKFGTLSNQLPNGLGIERTNDSLLLSLKEETRNTRTLYGLYRTLINNMVLGVSNQFNITLNLKGVGFRGSVQGKSLVLSLGFSHPVQMSIPEGITVEVVQNTTLNLKGCDKENLGIFAAKIRSWREPEPYKGKGIIYQGEIIRRKAGKSGKK